MELDGAINYEVHGVRDLQFLHEKFIRGQRIEIPEHARRKNGEALPKKEFQGSKGDKGKNIKKTAADKRPGGGERLQPAKLVRPAHQHQLGMPVIVTIGLLCDQFGFPRTCPLQLASMAHSLNSDHKGRAGLCKCIKVGTVTRRFSKGIPNPPPNLRDAIKRAISATPGQFGIRRRITAK